MEIPASYRRPKPALPEQDFWIDPDPERSAGLLLSDRILFYCQRVNLVFPFHESFLEPASYTLHAGREYIISTRPGHLEFHNLEEEQGVAIPPNGLIYIRFFEEVNIPHYMIARFNLRVTQVYRGLLLGTGPQVDPGFRGHLGCPIHNFTDEVKTIRFFEPLATIDFEKTTPLGETYFARRAGQPITEGEFAEIRAGAVAMPGINDLRCKIFNKRITAEFQSYLPGGESVRSSVDALNQAVTGMRREIQIYRGIGFISLIGLLFGAFTLYTNLKDDIASRYMDVKGNIVEPSNAVGRLEEVSRQRPEQKGEKAPAVPTQKGKPPPREGKPPQ